MSAITTGILVVVLTCLVPGISGFPEAAAAEKPRKTQKARKVSEAPKTFDLYIKQDKEIVRVPQGDLVFKTAFALGPDKSGLYGLADPPKITVNINKPMEIWLFDPEAAGALLRLAHLKYVETAPAHTFDLKTTRVSPVYFDKIYQVKFDEPLPFNLWCAQNDIPLHVKPVADKPGWYRAVPEKKLEAGNYVITFGCADGPRVYTGELPFHPFVLACVPEPPPPVCKPVSKAKRRRPPKETPAVACPPPPPPKACPPSAAPPPAAKQMDAGFKYVEVASAPVKREFQITNRNPVPWHNVNISVFMRDSVFPELVLGPVSLYKDVVLPEHTVSQAPDKTFMQYETIGDEGCKLYLKVKAKEGVIKKAWKNVGQNSSGQAELVEVPWDLEE